MTRSRRTTRIMLAVAAILTIVALTVGIHAYQHDNTRRLAGALSLQVGALCITWLALRRRPTTPVKPEPVVGYWTDEVANLNRNWVTASDPRAEALLAVVRKTGSGTCETDEEHFFASPEEMGIDAEAVGWKYYPCACGKEYDGRYDNEGV